LVDVRKTGGISMAAGLFLLFLIVLVLAFFKLRMASLVLGCITVGLAVLLFIHHITEALSIRL